MIIELICQAATADSFAYTEAIQGKVIRENEEQRGVKLHYWSDGMLDAFRKAWGEVAVELSAESPMFKETWEDLSAFRKDYRYWQTYGFLPRPKAPTN